MKVADIFRTTGQPTITYVPRDSGHYERRLNGYLDEKGQLCLITGPSKTGKSTLYKRVLEERGQIPLVVQCTSERTATEMWKVALEQVNFDRVRSITEVGGSKLNATVDLGTKFGWKWLAEVSGKFTGGVAQEFSESKIRERVLSEASPDVLIPFLSKTNYVLVIEDFHYLSDKEKILLFQQWKRFVDNEITILILGTTHRAIDIASSNKDLIGRVAQIDIGQWESGDLAKICTQGFQQLKVKIDKDALNKICVEAVGLPIIVQQVCLQVMLEKGVEAENDVSKKNVKSIDVSDVRRSFTEVANTKYSQFGVYYRTLIRGPKEKTRKYKTYELI